MSAWLAARKNGADRIGRLKAAATLARVLNLPEPNALASGIYPLGPHSEAPEASAYGSKQIPLGMSLGPLKRGARRNARFGREELLEGGSKSECKPAGAVAATNRRYPRRLGLHALRAGGG